MDPFFAVDNIVSPDDDSADDEDVDNSHYRETLLMHRVITITNTLTAYDNSTPIAVFEYLKLFLGKAYQKEGLFYFTVITRLLIVFRQYQKEKADND